MVWAVRILAATVWLVFGLGLKVLGFDPRHEQIVAAVVGEGIAGPVTLAVGLGETALACWILSGRFPIACACVQTGAIVSMNALEIAHARHILYSPALMLSANVAFLALVWWAALKSARRRPVVPVEAA
jgi:hypothetical protein